MTKRILTISLLLTSCSYISGPEGLFPPTKDKFLEEKVEENIMLPMDLELFIAENHYPVDKTKELLENQDVPKPRQIFSSSGNSSVQLRRLGELMWIYVETLPSTSWPISKSFWETSSYEIIENNPISGVIDISYDETSILKMKIEHGIKEASTEIFLAQIDIESEEILSNPELIQTELSSLVSYFAESVGQFSGTSLAAQNLNEMKKAKIFVEDGRTVIELDLNFDRAWSSVSKAMDASNIYTNDRDRSNGIFYVSYSNEEDGGFLSFLNFRKNTNENIIFDDSQFEVKIDKIIEAEKLISIINESLS